ncbi:MAG: crotonase/enoyl-CoA hydratase family protein [Oleibacter sp.]|nr:crotonase/enoyl-CoA hydratase family protein [Thalassolituus sp.]
MNSSSAPISENIDTARVLCEVRDAIAWVTLNRPEKHNGLDMKMFYQMTATAKRIRKDRSIRAVILQGAGPSFSAGLDFKAVSSNPKDVARLFLKWPWRKLNLAQDIAHCWRDLPIPVICAIHGNCFGGGMQIALATDYRIAHPDSLFSIMEMKWGLIPDMSGMVTLSQLTRIDIAQELTMTGRQFSAQEAFEYGLISRLADDPAAAAEELAKVIVSKSPDAVAATKYLFKKTWQADTNKTLRWERWVQMRLLGRKNNRIAINNGMTKDETKKRPFKDRTSFR